MLAPDASTRGLVPTVDFLRQRSYEGLLGSREAEHRVDKASVGSNESKCVAAQLRKVHSLVDDSLGLANPPASVRTLDCTLQIALGCWQASRLQDLSCKPWISK